MVRLGRPGGPDGGLASASARTLERDQRLSGSLLWQLQRRYFERQGVAAWSQGTVPHYITSNPFIAGAYARIVLGFLRDCRAVADAADVSGMAEVQAASGRIGFARLDPTEPVYVLELGAGAGRFAHQFLRQLLGSPRHPVLEGLQLRYVMSDFAEATLAYWDAHPQLRPWVEQGWLDFARFDVAAEGDLVLRHSGAVLSPGAVKNPLVVIANYVFDSLPNDAFYVGDGRLYESLITLAAPEDAPDPTDPALLGRLEISHANHPVDGVSYEDPDCQAVLRDYGVRLSEASLLFPCAAMQCIRHLHRLSGGRLLLLAADRGYSDVETLAQRQEPSFNVHGCLSMAVNFHALGEYVRELGGQALHPAHRPVDLNVSAFLCGDHPGGFAETRRAYAEAIEPFGPDDFFALKQGVEQAYGSMTLRQVLAYVRLSGWDANVFLGCFTALFERVAAAGELERRELRAAVRDVWEAYFPIGETRDLPFHLGALLYGIGDFREALEYFQHSARLHGPGAATAYNMALCHHALGQTEAALAHVNQALSLDPTLAAAEALRADLQ